MKKILRKEVIVAFIIGIIIASSIAVYAYSYFARDISYTKPGTDTAISVETAINELYANHKEIKPLEIEIGPFEMGSRSGYENYNPVKLNELENFSSLTVQCGGNMGTYISAKIYIDDVLITTISDTLEHTLELNNNDELQVNFYTYNGLNNGFATIKVKAQ